jgi:hypothetical protein
MRQTLMAWEAARQQERVQTLVSESGPILGGIQKALLRQEDEDGGIFDDEAEDISSGDASLKKEEILEFGNSGSFLARGDLVDLRYASLPLCFAILLTCFVTGLAIDQSLPCMSVKSGNNSNSSLYLANGSNTDRYF